MNVPRRTAAFLPLVALALALAAPTARAAAPIAPWILERTAGGAPAEFLVVLGDQADLTAAARIPDKVGKGRFVRDALYARAQASQAPLIAWLDANGVRYHAYYIVNAILVEGTLEVAQTIAARPEVARLEGNPEFGALQPVVPTRDELDAQGDALLAPEAVEAGLTAIRAPEVWAMGFTGQGIVIGDGDTGVQWDHPALINHYRGWNGASANHDYDWHDSIHSGGGPCGPNAAAPCDDNNHGTHTVGTTVGDDAGTNQIGVAPGAKWIACRNMDQGNGTPARYIECMEWFLAPYPVGGTPAEGDPALAPDITTNSWTCPASEGCTPASLQAAVEAQRAAGILFVAAAGNSGSSCSTVSEPPSFYDASYTVGAFSAATGAIASFSSRGPVTADGSNRIKPDITAPGVGVRSSIRGNAYASFNGTSMATPHVAGAVALLWSARPSLKNQIAETEDLLNQTAVDVTTTNCGASGVPNATWGWGKLDIKAAVDIAVVSVSDPAAPAGLWLAPALPNPSHRAATMRFRLAQAGGVDLAIFSSDGRRVRTLAHGDYAAGEHVARWDGRDDRGGAAPAGVYHARLRAGAEATSTKLIWLGHR